VKIVILRQGGCSYLVPEDTNLSNTGVDVYIIKALCEMGHEIIIGTHPIKGSEEMASSGKYSWLNNVKYDYGNVEVAKDADLIYVMAGTDNLRVSKKINDEIGSVSLNLDLLSKIRSAPGVPIMYVTMDPDLPPYLCGELLDHMVGSVVAPYTVMNNRNLIILMSGTDSLVSIDNLKKLYGTSMIDLYKGCIPVCTSPDIHFISEDQISIVNIPIYESPEKVLAFAGKNRIGSKTNRTKDLIMLMDGMDEARLNLIGSWKIKKDKDGNLPKDKVNLPDYDKVTYFHKVKYEEVISIYNKSFASIYIGNAKYDSMNMLSRRVLDMISANTLMLILRKNEKQFKGIISDDLISQLLTDKDNIEEQLSMPLEKRKELILRTREEFIENSKLGVIKEQLKKIVNRIPNLPSKDIGNSFIESYSHGIMNHNMKNVRAAAPEKLKMFRNLRKKYSEKIEVDELKKDFKENNLSLILGQNYKKTLNYYFKHEREIL